MRCAAATGSPGPVTNTLLFGVDSAVLDARQSAEVASVAAAWHATGGSVVVRVDGYASTDYTCEYNWDLSCHRARAVADALARPSGVSSGVPAGAVKAFAHGESDEAGPGLGANRRVLISVPLPSAVAPSTKPPPAGCLPRTLGSGRHHNPSAADFKHHDFPSIKSSSEQKLAAWADLHPVIRFSRRFVTDFECEVEMRAALALGAGAAGTAAYRRFVAGTGGTETLDATTTLGKQALAAPSFLATVARVRRSIEAQLATQAASGSLDPCALSVKPPPTFFKFGDGFALKTVIGGTQGETLLATSFLGSATARTYMIGLRFLIDDHFGVDEDDLYPFPGLFAFWVLQHERGTGSNYVPFVNELDLPIVLSGRF